MTESPKLGERKIFIGGLSYETTDDKLRQYFAAYGTVTDAVVMKDPISRRSRGFGFITYADAASVDRALAQTSHVLDNRRVEAKRAVPRADSSRDLQVTTTKQTTTSVPSPSTSSVASPALSSTSSTGGGTKKIFVGGLHYETKDAEFRRYFEQFGKVASAEVMFNRETNKSRGFGFVIFEHEFSVDSVLKEKKHVIDRKAVEVKRAVPRTEAPPRARGSSGGVSSNSGETTPTTTDPPTTPTSSGVSAPDGGGSQSSSTPTQAGMPIKPASRPHIPPPIAPGSSLGGYAAAVRYGTRSNGTTAPSSSSTSGPLKIAASSEDGPSRSVDTRSSSVTSITSTATDNASEDEIVPKDMSVLPTPVPPLLVERPEDQLIHTSPSLHVSITPSQKFSPGEGALYTPLGTQNPLSPIISPLLPPIPPAEKTTPIAREHKSPLVGDGRAVGKDLPMWEPQSHWTQSTLVKDHWSSPHHEPISIPLGRSLSSPLENWAALQEQTQQAQIQQQQWPQQQQSNPQQTALHPLDLGPTFTRERPAQQRSSFYSIFGSNGGHSGGHNPEVENGSSFGSWDPGYQHLALGVGVPGGMNSTGAGPVSNHPDGLSVGLSQAASGPLPNRGQPFHHIGMGLPSREQNPGMHYQQQGMMALRPHGQAVGGPYGTRSPELHPNLLNNGASIPTAPYGLGLGGIGGGGGPLLPSHPGEDRQQDNRGPPLGYDYASYSTLRSTNPVGDAHLHGYH